MTDRGKAQRRVAMVTYFFPPLGGGGVQRMLKYITYLPENGWRPVVFTPRNPVYEIRDPGLVSAVPENLEVRRSFIFEPSRIYRWLVKLTGYRGRMRSLPRSGGVPGRDQDQTASTRSVASSQEDARPRLGLWANIARLAFFPDEQLSWVPFALRSIRAVAKDEPFEAIISSSPPITAHLVAAWAKGPKTPWIADFRDPWVDNAFAPELPWSHRRLRRRIERWIVHRADVALFATPALTSAYATRYPDVADRFVTMTNGYDREDFLRTVSGSRAENVFRIVYAGSLYGERELQLFTDGLARALDLWPELGDRLRVDFVGWISGNNQAVAERIARSETLGGIVSFIGFRPRAEALGRIAAADAALLILADEPGKGLFVPGKLYDYIGLDRPILAIVPDGDVRNILDELNWGVVVKPQPEAIAHGIERLVTNKQPAGPADPDGRYDRRAITTRLAALLDDVAGRAATVATK